MPEREKTPHGLEEKEHRYRTLVESSPLPMSVTIGGTIVYVNKRRLELTGHTDPAALIETSGLDHIHPDDRAHITERLKARNAGEEVSNIVQFRLIRLDGSTIHVEDHMSDAYWMGQEAVIHSLVDVTQSLSYGEKLEALHRHASSLVMADSVHQVAEASLATIKEALGFSSASFSLVKDGELTFIHVLGLNEAYYQTLKLDGPGVTVRAARTRRTQLVGDTRLDPNYFSGYAAGMNEVHLSELDVPVIVDGDTVAVINVEHQDLNAFDASDARLVEILAQHVSSAFIRLRERERLREFSEKLEALHRHAHRLATAGSPQEVGQVTFSIFEDVLGFSVGDFGLVSEGYLEAVYEHGMSIGDSGVLDLGGPGVVVRAAVTGETQLVRDTRLDPDYVKAEVDGSQTLSELAVPVMIGGGVAAVINVESTELNRFTEVDQLLIEIMAEHVASALERIRRLEEVQAMERAKFRDAVENAAKMSSMVRHDLRGPLSVIRNSVYLLRKKHGDGEILDLVDRSAVRAAEILEELREHTWMGDITPALSDLVALVREAVEGLGAPEGVRVELVFRDEAVYGWVDGEKVRRVVDNLVLNAFDAMPEGGVLGVEEWTEGGYLYLRVSDTGVGVLPENLGKLFTPFYTSKPKGMGLGLTYCRQVVEAHGGAISVESEAGRGTSFTVKLPLGEEG